ncbi:VWA domain-containing protein [Planosporangium thailandense]|uniref:VWA domain-containing protein n=1 Tax=Planosporangium thailandense TaxID=765197 RepID=A0ABX0Y859_9ACTN|nr:VWA domain-containing protein [Planosporangium thailandense]NJC73587.1 VWA domain-containing protein [Planosporangium thailandense]
MRRRRWALVVGLLAGALAGAPAAADPGTRLSVSDVRTVDGRLTFAVTAYGLPAGTVLDGGSLRVDVDGEPLRAMVVPAPQPSPTVAPDRSVVLVLDTSGSMEGARLTAAKAAATGYADALPADVRLGLVSVSDKPTTVLAPTADRGAFRAAVAAVRAHGGTALYDGVQQAADLLTGSGERRIVVLSDGTDTSSTATPDAVGSRLAAAAITLDGIAYGPDARSPAMNDLAAGTGGRVVAAGDAAALRAAFADIAAAIRPASAAVTVTVPARLAGADASLHVALTADGATVAAADTPVRFAPGPPLVAAPATDSPRWLLYLAVGGIGLAVLLAAAVVMYLLVGRSPVRNRLRQLEGFGSAPAVAVRDENPVLRAALEVSEQAIARRGNLARIEADLDRAGLDLRPAEWILLRAGVAAIGGVLLALLLPWLLGLLLGVVVGWLATGVYRRLRASRRASRFNEELPDALQLVVSALRSGFSFPQAIGALVSEGDEAVAGEFGRALAETRLGGDLEDALLRTAERTASADLAWLVMAIRVQREVGGTLSEVLETAVETMRERGRLRRHVRALSAEGRLSAWVLIAMPVLLAAFMFTTRREYLRPLYTTPIGLTMLFVAVVMMALGTFWITRVVKVEV